MNYIFHTEKLTDVIVMPLSVLFEILWKMSEVLGLEKGRYSNFKKGAGGEENKHLLTIQASELNFDSWKNFQIDH